MVSNHPPLGHSLSSPPSSGLLRRQSQDSLLTHETTGLRGGAGSEGSPPCPHLSPANATSVVLLYAALRAPAQAFAGGWDARGRIRAQGCVGLGGGGLQMSLKPGPRAE